MKISWPAVNALAGVAIAISAVFGAGLAYVALLTPDSPEWITAEGDPNSISVRWAESTSGNVSGYRVLRRGLDDPSGKFHPIEETQAAHRQFVDEDCKQYCVYRVTALSTSGRESRWSRFVTCERKAGAWKCPSLWSKDMPPIPQG